jgi:hypothetical protein
VTALEENPNSSLAHGLQHRNDASTSDHERRIAALEAQLYALQMQANQAPTSRQGQLDFPQPTLQHSPHQSTFNQSSFGLASPANGHTVPPFQPASHGSLHSRYNSASSLKHEVDSQGGYATDGMTEYSATKRWKGDERADRGHGQFAERPDFISRGVVTEEEAAMCFDS